MSFDLERGTIHALLGGNGSGKSTLIKILAGVQPADAGRIFVGEREFDATSVTPDVSREANLRFVHQQNSTFGALSVAENLHIGRGFETDRGGRIAWSRVRRRTRALLDRFQINARPDQLVSELGRATQTMLAIARALQDQEDAHSGILVLDEPTSSLPAVEVDLLFDALRRYAAEGQTIMFVTHRFDEVLEIADRATMLRDGRFVATVPRAQMTEDGLVELMVGRALAHESGVAEATPTGEVVLTCEGLRGGALRDVSFSLRKGEILGIAGLLGSGRSTLLQTLFGLVRPEAGRMTLDGSDLRPASPRAAMRAGLAYVPEDRVAHGAFLELPVTDNIGLTVLGRYFRHGVFHHRAERADSRQVMSRFLVKAASERARFASLSGGNQQKVILARWLRRDPRILLLDEPTQGVDIGARIELYGLIREATEHGTSVIVVSSEFEELERLCERVLVFQRGRVTAQVRGNDLRADRLEQLVQGGTQR